MKNIPQKLQNYGLVSQLFEKIKPDKIHQTYS